MEKLENGLCICTSDPKGVYTGLDELKVGNTYSYEKVGDTSNTFYKIHTIIGSGEAKSVSGNYIACPVEAFDKLFTVSK